MLNFVVFTIGQKVLQVSGRSETGDFHWSDALKEKFNPEWHFFLFAHKKFEQIRAA